MESRTRADTLLYGEQDKGEHIIIWRAGQGRTHYYMESRTRANTLYGEQDKGKHIIIWREGVGTHYIDRRTRWACGVVVCMLP